MARLPPHALKLVNWRSKVRKEIFEGFLEGNRVKFRYGIGNIGMEIKCSGKGRKETILIRSHAGQRDFRYSLGITSNEFPNFKPAFVLSPIFEQDKCLSSPGTERRGGKSLSTCQYSLSQLSPCLKT